jgi:uncharacterized protein
MRRSFAAALVSWSAVALVISAALADAQTLPKPTHKVGDFAGILTPQARAELQSLLAALEEDTTAEVVVATTSSLGGMSVEEYGNRVFKEWRIGKAALDNGVLVLVAPTERQVRIEVGYGLEGVIPDALAGAIIRDDFLPAFRNGNYEAGILTGVRRVATVVRAKQVLTPEQVAALESSSRPEPLGWLLFGTIVVLWLAAVAMAGLMFGEAVNARSASKLIFGMVAVATFAGLPIFVLARTAFLVVPVLLAGGVWGYRRSPLRGGMAGSGSASGWDWSVSSGSSGSDSGSSSSDSSDSGGGGSSGGGGASGSW